MIVVRCTEVDRQALKSIDIDPDSMADDGTVYTNVRINKPWGHEIEKYRDGTMAVWWLHIHSYQQTSMHCHPNKTTALIIVGGRATLDTLNGSHSLSEGDLVIIEPGAFHRTNSSFGDGLVLYEIETPPNKHDLARLIDPYGRGQGYERIQRTQ